MSRSSTPSSVADDQCSEQMIFAAPNPDDAAYGSKPEPVPRATSYATRAPYAQSSSMASRPATAFSAHTSGVSRSWQCESDEVQPYSLMGAGPGLAMTFQPSHRQSSKPKLRAKTGSESAPQSQTERSLRLPFKKMKRLGTRRSISSFDFFASADAEPQDPTASSSTLSSSTSGMSSDGGMEVRTPSGDDPSEVRVVVAHKVVGDVWEQQDLGQVIPALRSLRVSGKLGL